MAAITSSLVMESDAMDYRQPSEVEMLKLQKLHATHKRWPVLGPAVILPILAVQFFSRNASLSVALVALALVIFVYHGLAISVFSKCPRCSSRVTLPRGNCTSCGMRLEIPCQSSAAKSAT